ncbi:MAG: Asp-tRNA(Asn)/Glu-tRNA(Gln) amidotransferase subunit GatA [Myxococcota bacterium]|nr:Asp-tRNA(Asn)/Glu-tRNA(Gln) amidotransferase subunit GatA [Myxococcota bacterium]
MTIHHQSATQLTRIICAGDVSAYEVTTASLEQIQAENPTLNAAITICAEKAQAAAKRLDESIRRGEIPGPLAGVPIVVKDNLCTEGVETTAGSHILRGHIPPFTATAVARLVNAGAIIVAKSNLDEFAMGSSTEHSAFGATKNPWDHTRVPGGSSGGSAAAVAAGWAPISLGSDTGGSIRQPASLCGVYGLKPTWGRVSRFGLIAFASSLDQVGPFARTAQDLAAALQVMAGHDPHDATSTAYATDALNTALEKDIRGQRIGICPEWMSGNGLSTGVADTVSHAIEVFEKMGAKIVEVTLPKTQEALAAYYVLAPAEASSNLARFDGVRFGVRNEANTLPEMYKSTRGTQFGDEVIRRILLGTFVLSDGYREAYYRQAQRVRGQITHEFESAFADCDLIASPTSPVIAPLIGAQTDPLAMYRMDEFTIGANLAGLPALSIPCGYSDSMPVGLQLLAPKFREERLLSIAAAYERHAGQPGVAS